MKGSTLFVALYFLLVQNVVAQEMDTLTIAGTKLFKNVPYAAAHKQQNMDVYLPEKTTAKTPLIVWIHGGAWKMGYKKWIEVAYLAQQGFAIASIDYRFSGDSIFPAQISDCNAAIYYLWKNADRYNIDTSKIIVGGGSAGGHLASLIGTSHNNHIKGFYPYDVEKEHVSIKAVLDFYGPSDFYAFHVDYFETDKNSTPITELLGASPLARPDLAKIASPTTYIDKNDPPFLIIHGDKDDMVPMWQSILFTNSLALANVRAELVTIAGAGHAGPAFSAPDIQQKVISFLDTVIKK